MRVYVAGATGAIGRQLLPRLQRAGHTVVAGARSQAKFDSVVSDGAEPVIVDPLDEESVTRAVVAAAPDAVIHQLTALSGSGNLRRFDQEFAVTNRLRTEGLDLLVGAAREAGAKRFIAQSFVGWNNERTGGPVKWLGR